jgi:Flp pilus assembly protein TadD
MKMVQNQAEDRARLKRVLPERAIALAMQNRWSEAADINRKIIELYPNDADAYNRLGKALMEMGRYRDALATYQRAIELDPNNIIAKKNVERLMHLADKVPRRSQASNQRHQASRARRRTHQPQHIHRGDRQDRPDYSHQPRRA